MLNKLTTAQKNMYDTDQFFNNTSICNVGGYIFLKGNTDINILKKAINELLKRADGLRVRLKIEDLIPYQYIEEYKEEYIEELKLDKETYDDILQKKMKELFDISSKLYDFKVINVDENIGLYIKLHHIISDAWSMTLIANKIIQYYNLISVGKLIEDNIPSYLNFIQSESKYLESQKYLKDKEYWENKYTKKPVYVTMSPNKKSELNPEAGRTSFNLTNSESKKVYEYCENNSISLAIFFEAIITLYLSRINNANNVTLCSVVINRNGIEEKNTIGMFNNILPLTIPMENPETFLSLCERISTEHYQIFRHQKYPLENILKYVREQYEKDTVLYDVMVSYQNAEFNDEDVSNAKWIFNGTSDLGFMMNISDINKNGIIHIDFDWRKNCFKESEINNIYARFMSILEQVVNNVSITLDEIEIVTKEEKEEILVKFNDTKREYPNKVCLPKYLEENTLKNPNKVALRYKDKEITYKEFNERVNSLAHYLRENIKDRNVIVGVMFERSFEMMIAIYAIIKAGHSYMPMDPHFPAERIEFMLEDSNTPVILTQTKWVNMFETFSKIIVDVDKFDYEKYDNTNLKIDSLSTDVAYVIYTSGSTGKPKGAMIQHHSVVNRIKWMHDKYPLLNNDVVLQKTPYTFDVSVWELFWWSMYDGTLKILIPEGHKDPMEIIQAVEEGKVTHMHFVPSMLNAFLEYLDANKKLIEKLKSVRYVFVSGEALQVKHVKKFYELLESNKTTLHNLYGPTECTVDVSYFDCKPDSDLKSIPIGKPVDNTQLLVLDKTGNLLPVGIIGELYISGVLVGKGYINRDELTKEKFVPNKYYDFPTMYKTGDLSMWLPDGNIEYCGRTDFQIKIRGLRVELGDIENAMLKYEGIKQTIVTVFDANGEKNICAYYTANKEIDISDLKVHLGKILPDYMVPQYYVELEKIPVNANGKADRKALPTPEIKNQEEEYIEPKIELEKKIQEYAQEVLEMEKVSCESDLFNYGLTSLGVISIIVKLSTDGYELKVRDFYEQKTIKEIAHLLENSIETIDDYEEDRKLYSDVSDIKDHLLPIKKSNTILLTGATSFLGIHIIQEIISNTDKEIYCIIRNEEKFERFVKKYTTINYPNPRLILVNGDITKEDIGFDEKLANEIKEKVGDIIHCAADVSFFCSWEKAKLTNYIGTCNVLKFAEEAKAKLHHISTMSVSGDILTRQTKEYPKFTENDLYIGQLYKENVYAHSKYLAEKEIIKAIREDKVNASIYRVANLTWRASDGKFQENYEANDLYILTSVMLKYNKIPLELMKENISLTPVDDCAKAIEKLLEKKENGIYNLYSQNSMSIEEYMRMIGTSNAVTIKEFYNELQKETDIQVQFVLMYIAGILEDASKSVVRIINNKTNTELSGLGYKWSTLGEKYIKMFENIGGEQL